MTIKLRLVAVLQQSLLRLILLFMVTGCGDDPSGGPSTPNQQTRPPDPQTKQPAKRQRPQIDETVEKEVASTHLVTRSTVYYKAGPQQASPPDGEFAPGTKVKLLEEAGSYVLVRS